MTSKKKEPEEIQGPPPKSIEERAAEADEKKAMKLVGEIHAISTTINLLRADAKGLPNARSMEAACNLLEMALGRRYEEFVGTRAGKKMMYRGLQSVLQKLGAALSYITVGDDD